MAGDKTHELEIRTIEHKEGPNVPPGGPEAAGEPGPEAAKESGPEAAHDGRAHPHQESRDHHKHNNPGQEGHKRQKHGPAEEKH